jgi:hypothetical protein
MATDNIERVHYYQRQFLGAEDFNAEQAYHRDMRRRHNLAQHTWGIVAGLELQAQHQQGDPSARDIFIQPGFAVDGFGREIVVLHAQPLDPQLFAAFTGTRTLTVWLTYAEAMTHRPAAGYEDCQATDSFSRLSEAFGVLVEPKGDEHDPLTVDDKTAVPYDPTKTPAPNTFVLPADGSAPYQQFPPDEDRPAWRLKLGSVVWDGNARVFRDTAPEVLAEGRTYAGAVADKLLAPAGKLRIAPRQAFADPAQVDAFAQLEGPLRVDGKLTAKTDVFLHGGKVYVQGKDGADDNVVLWAGRGANDSGPGVDLRVHIGEPFKPAEPAKLARLSIGPVASGGKEKTVFAVRNDDKAELPTGSLEFRSAMRQFINVEQGQYGSGYQQAAMYWRSGGDFYWYRGGVHDDGNGQPGTGGVALMRLEAGGKLHALGAAEVHGDFTADGPTRVRGPLSTDQNITVAPSGDSFLRTRHVQGKDSGSDFVGPLYLNWNTGKNVVVGRAGGPTSDFEVNGALRVAGPLSVTGNNNLFKVKPVPLALRNGGINTPRTWSISYAGEFSEVYAVFAVLQGFSLWNHDGDTSFPMSPGQHAEDLAAIVQHMLVRVTAYNVNGASGEVYCSESRAANEADNTVLFSVIVMGRPA